jgi:hypothetical protein
MGDVLMEFRFRPFPIQLPPAPRKFSVISTVRSGTGAMAVYGHEEKIGGNRRRNTPPNLAEDVKLAAPCSESYPDV